MLAVYVIQLKEHTFVYFFDTFIQCAYNIMTTVNACIVTVTTYILWLFLNRLAGLENDLEQHARDIEQKVSKNIDFERDGWRERLNLLH